MERFSSRACNVECARFLGFIAVNTLVVGIWTAIYWLTLPFLQKEPATFLLLPVLLITMLVTAGLYRFVRHYQSHAARFAALYLSFVLGLLLLGLYLGVWSWYQMSTRPDYHTGIYQAWWSHFCSVPLVLLAGHWFGVPVFLVVGFVNKLCSPLFSHGH